MLGVARKEVLSLGALFYVQRHCMEQEALNKVALLRVKKKEYILFQEFKH